MEIRRDGVCKAIYEDEGDASYLIVSQTVVGQIASF